MRNECAEISLSLSTCTLKHPNPCIHTYVRGQCLGGSGREEEVNNMSEDTEQPNSGKRDFSEKPPNNESTQITCQVKHANTPSSKATLFVVLIPL